MLSIKSCIVKTTALVQKLDGGHRLHVCIYTQNIKENWYLIRLNQWFDKNTCSC